MTEEIIPIEYAIIMINAKPSCIWEYQSIKEKNLRFVDNIDHTYFEFLAKTYLTKLNTKKNEHRAAISIRAAYSHGLETLFFLLGAFIQAPYCLPGWILLCSNQDLRDLINKINSHQKVASVFKNDWLDWNSIAEYVFQCFQIDDIQKRTEIVSGFAQLWHLFANDFTNETFVKEYNSIKHGFRVKTGGFSLQMGTQKEIGIPAAPESMVTMGSSKFGASFLDVVKIGNTKNHFYFNNISRNWDPEDMVGGLLLISQSIANVISAIKVLNGVNPRKIKYVWPSNLESFNEPWKRAKTIGVLSMRGFSYEVTGEVIKNFNTIKLCDLYNEGRYLFRENRKIRVDN